MAEQSIAKYRPIKPDFTDNGNHPRPNISSMADVAEAYAMWAKNSGLFDYVDEYTFRAVARLNRVLREPIPHGNFKGQPRFIPESIARKVGVDPVPIPDGRLSFLGGQTLRERLATLMYHQGSSEFGSSQQQSLLDKKLGYEPPIFEKYKTFVIREEGEHGIQAVYYLGEVIGGNYGWGLAEDLLARQADSDDPMLQQPLREFNPMVTTLPELGHYFDKQDRDGWNQLEQQKGSCDGIYAGDMRYFLRQEPFHLAAGHHSVSLYVEAGRIPMDLHTKLAAEWEARANRLHGNPYNSGGAETNYVLGTKSPIVSLEILAERGDVLRMPHRDYGFVEIPVRPDMPKGHLNGVAIEETRKKFRTNNKRLSALLNPDQRRDLRRFLKNVTMYVPNKERNEILESGEIPTVANSWRPDHLMSVADQDDWPHLKGYYTDIFGYPIPSKSEYEAYCMMVRVTEADRERIRDLTSTPGWMVEVKPGSRHDVYRNGAVQPTDEDTVLFEFTVGTPRKRGRIYTFPQRMGMLRAEQKPTAYESVDGRDFLDQIHADLMGNDGK